MGGTSFDVALIHDGAGVFTQERTFADQVIQLPMMDIDTIGAGGGSIGWIDAGGALRVGPQSAGASPGPACYGRGGTQPTVTDANLVLGRLAPHSAMAGGFELDIQAARQAIEELAKPLALSVEAAAKGIIQVVNANMTSAIRRMTVERGHDPREFALCPFGGAGPLHAAELAREMGVKEVIIPTMPGVFSAAGLLRCELREEELHSRIGLLREMIGELPSIFDELLEAPLRRLAGSRIGDSSVHTARRLRLRYLGQGHDLSVHVPDGSPDLATIERDFHAAHRRAYGYDFVDDAIEVVAAWVSAALGAHANGAAHWPEDSGNVSPVATRRVVFSGNACETPIYTRDQLGAGFNGNGPAIIEQPDTTTLILPGQRFQVDSYGQIILHSSPSPSGRGRGEG
jgi:N-methylhydantoinase A